VHDNAWIYDLEVGGFDLDVPFWLSLLEERPVGRALDLGCGTGRITFPLAERGRDLCDAFHVVGLDISAPLLSRAQERHAALDPDKQTAISFVEGNMIEFELDGRFDLIIVGLNTLMYIYDLDDQISCISAIRRHLAPGGRLAIDVLMPSFQFLQEAERTPALRLELDLSEPAPDISRFLRFASERYNPATQRDDTTYIYEIHKSDRGTERLTDDLAWHMYFPRELELLMRIGGLHPVAQFGGYAREPFDRRSRQCLWVMEAIDG
jgi:SAM-dependent methyltransferase